MEKKGGAVIIIVAIVIASIFGVGGYLIFFEDKDNKIISTNEKNLDESSEENEESTMIARSTYYNIINNIGDYEGEELVFEEVRIISKSFGDTMPYWIEIVEEDGTSISLPFFGRGVPPHMQTNRRWIIEGIVEKEARGYYLNVTGVTIIN